MLHGNDCFCLIDMRVITRTMLELSCSYVRSSRLSEVDHRSAKSNVGLESYYFGLVHADAPSCFSVWSFLPKDIRPLRW